jgi:hypothetical protein
MQRTMFQMMKDLKTNQDEQERLINEAQALHRQNQETLDQIAIMIGILPQAEMHANGHPGIAGIHPRGGNPLDTSTRELLS